MHVSKQKQIAAARLRAKILATLLSSPGISQTEIADKFEVSTATISRHVKSIRQDWARKKPTRQGVK